MVKSQVAWERTTDAITDRVEAQLCVQHYSPSVALLTSCSLSQGGAISVDVKRNEEAYGAGVSATDLLTGAVKGPHEFEPLYKRLEEIKATAPAS